MTIIGKIMYDFEQSRLIKEDIIKFRRLVGLNFDFFNYMLDHYFKKYLLNLINARCTKLNHIVTSTPASFYNHVIDYVRLSFLSLNLICTWIISHNLARLRS